MDLNWPYIGLGDGLCGTKAAHQPHIHLSPSLGWFRCHADQTKRLPYALEAGRGR